MIEFHAGTGPDSQSIGIALEEGFLDYRVTRAEPAPAIVDGGARIEGMQAILLYLAGRSGRFLPKQREEAAGWVSTAAEGALDLGALGRQLASAPYILGELSIADMALFPLIACEPALTAGHPEIARWAQCMSRRSATGRGMGALAR